MDKLIQYFEYPFVTYALIAGILIALCSSLLGVTLVLKRLSFIGDGLSHVAFCIMSIATVTGLSNNLLLVLPVTIAFAVLLLCSSPNVKIRGDAMLAMISVGSLAVGYLIMNLFLKSANLAGDVCATLFGSTAILTLSELDVWLCAGLSVVVLIIFLLFYPKIFAITFDENFAKATGVNVRRYNLIFAIVIGLVISLSMKLVGSLLISALVIFPALSAMRVFKSFKQVTICSTFVSVICAGTGIIVSILAGTPVGATIVAVDILGFILFSIVGLRRI